MQLKSPGIVHPGSTLRKWFVGVLMLATSVYANGPFMDFPGSYHISSAPIIDPKRNFTSQYPRYLAIKGQVAEQIYNQLESEPMLSECGVNHYTKSVGHFECSFYPSNGDFSVNLKRKEWQRRIK